MRNKLTILIIGLCLGLAVQAETTITYQGQLQDSSGPFSGNPGMEFRFYLDAEDGNPLEELVFSAVEVVDGVFQVDLTVDRAVFADLPVYLEVEVAGNVLTPRQSITPTPVAVRALSADDVAFSAGDGLVLTEKTFSLDSDFTDGRYWRQGGNAGTDPASDFLGTTDDTSFEIHVDGEHALRIQPADIPNIIGGWAGNTVATHAFGATIGGGGCPDLGLFPCGAEEPNQVTSSFGTIGGGLGNTAGELWTTVGGGWSNSASGFGSVVPGGLNNEASGNYSFAAGQRAKAENTGAFVWADNTDGDFVSTGNNQFLIRASGGVGIGTNDPGGFDLAVNGNASVGTLQLNTLIGTGSETLCRGTNNFVSECNSSGRYKEEVNTVEDGESRVLELNPVHFSWKETGLEDMGLIAEEVAMVEPRLVNRDESGTVTGVRYRHLTALLISAVQEQSAAIERMEEENAELRQLAERNAELEDRLAALENLLLEDRAVAVGQ